MDSRLLFKASANVEILAGIAFLAAPSLVVGLLLGEGIGASGGMNGILLWPAAILPALIGAMMLWIILAAPHNEQS